VETSDVTTFYGAVRALETIAEVLQRISPRWFGKERRCGVHGKHDRGLAAEMYGRLAVLKFERLDGAARRDALKLCQHCVQASTTARGRRGCCRALNALGPLSGRTRDAFMNFLAARVQSMTLRMCDLEAWMCYCPVDRTGRCACTMLARAGGSCM
jgi:hypothetical protein